MMQTRDIILGGLIGTMCMTVFTSLVFNYVLMLPYHVIRILAHILQFHKVSSMVTAPPVFIFILAVLLHYLIGLLFSLAYQLLLHYGTLMYTARHAFLFGCVIGAIGIIGWILFFVVHPGPPHIALKKYLLVIWLGHVLLGLALFYAKKFFVIEPTITSIPLCSLQ